MRPRAWYQMVARAHVGPQIATRYFVIATRRLYSADCVSRLKGQVQIALGLNLISSCNISLNQLVNKSYKESKDKYNL